MGLPRQEYWSGLPFPSPGHLSDPGIEPMPPAWQVNSLSLSYLGSSVWSLSWLFCNTTDQRLPGSSVHGISQARILEWVAISFSRGYSQLRDWTASPALAGRFFTAPGKSQIFCYWLLIKLDCSQKTYVISIFENLWTVIWWPGTWSKLVNIPSTFEKMCILQLLNIQNKR